MDKEIHNRVSVFFFTHGRPNNKTAIDKIVKRILAEEQEYPGLIAITTKAGTWEYAITQIMMDIVDEE